MTVVAAIARHGRVVMGADRQTSYQDQAVFGARKVRRALVHGTPILLGVAGHGGGMGTMLRRLDELPECPDSRATDLDLDDWADELGAAMTGILAGLQPPLLDDGATAADYLLGARGTLWHLFTHQACRAADGVASLGIGSDVALGAMHVSLRCGMGPAEAVEAAVDLACRISPYCGTGPDLGPMIDTL